jgi:hypothetical protein
MVQNLLNTKDLPNSSVKYLILEEENIFWKA